MHLKIPANMNETERELADDCKRGEIKQINKGDWKDSSEKEKPCKEII